MRHRLAIFVAAFAVSCSHGPIPAPALAPPALDEGALVARGEAIVRNIAVCGGCHSADPKNPDGPLSGGREFRDWRIGVARAANLTSDRATGLGDWTDGEIARAIRNGVSRNGRLLAPVMPYEWFHEMSDQDALAVARYLRTLPPVHNSVAQSPNLIFKAGKALFLHPRPAMTVPMPAGGAAPEYGAYLTQHVGLCAECHTPKSGLLNRPDRSRLFAGTADPPKDFPANPSNITPDLATGIGRWSEAQFVTAIRTGVTPAGVHLHPFMPWPELRRMTDDDIRAMYAFLRTVPPVENAVPRR